MKTSKLPNEGHVNAVTGEKTNINVWGSTVPWTFLWRRKCPVSVLSTLAAPRLPCVKSERMKCG